jgi:hypothetical protein
MVHLEFDRRESMTPSPKKTFAKKKPSIQQLAEKQAKEVLARNEAARKARAKALAKNPKALKIRTEVTRYRATKTEQRTTTARVKTAGFLLAVGDSWFHYTTCDILTELHRLGYSIESSARAGDPIETMVAQTGQMDRFAAHLDKILDQKVTPKAILVSGGGDDIAGKEFGMLINNADSVIAGWNEQVLAGVIDTRIADAYRMMLTEINIICQRKTQRTFPILVHGYAHPVPDGRGVFGWRLLGPWLQPGFIEKRFAAPSAAATGMMAAVIDRFNTVLQTVAAEYGNVTYIDLRPTLPNGADYKTWWANELHPTGGAFELGPGFRAVAAKFQTVLSTLP